jgi:hypothetical protein
MSNFPLSHAASQQKNIQGHSPVKAEDTAISFLLLSSCAWYSLSAPINHLNLTMPE